MSKLRTTFQKKFATAAVGRSAFK